MQCHKKFNVMNWETIWVKRIIFCNCSFSFHCKLNFACAFDSRDLRNQLWCFFTQTDCEKDRKTERQNERKTDRQKDRKTERLSFVSVSWYLFVILSVLDAFLKLHLLKSHKFLKMTQTMSRKKSAISGTPHWDKMKIFVNYWIKLYFM